MNGWQCQQQQRRRLITEYNADMYTLANTHTHIEMAAVGVLNEFLPGRARMWTVNYACDFGKLHMHTHTHSQRCRRKQTSGAIAVNKYMSENRVCYVGGGGRLPGESVGKWVEGRALVINNWYAHVCTRTWRRYTHTNGRMIIKK